MEMNRRQFVLLTSALFVGCERQSDSVPTTAASEPVPTSAPATQEIDAGPLDEFGTDRVYDSHRDKGFFVIRRDDKLFAMSSICTHKGCKVRVADDQAFYCKCHGSTFDKDGKVTKGPAVRSLPRLEIAINVRQHVIVGLDRPLENDRS